MSKTQHLIGKTLRELGYTGSYVVYGPVTDQASYEEKGIEKTVEWYKEYENSLINLNYKYEYEQ